MFRERVVELRVVSRNDRRNASGQELMSGNEIAQRRAAALEAVAEGRDVNPYWREIP